MEFQNFEFATPDYALSVALRDEVLVKPLGLVFSEEDLSKEWDSFHLGAFDSAQNLCACLVLSPVSSTEIKMRQVAVHETVQGQGIGRRLVAYSEDFARAAGFRKVVLNARTSVRDFYTKLEYYIEGEEFEEVGIPHLKMYKEL